MKHTHDFDSDTFCDPSDWNKASYTQDLLAEIEPFPDVPARFREMSGLDSAGGVQFIQPGAGSNGDKPATIQG